MESVSSKQSRNGMNFHQFVKAAKEKKRFRFLLDGRMYVADEYKIDQAALWRIFRNEKDIVPMSIFMSFDELLEDETFEGISFAGRFEDMEVEILEQLPEPPKPEAPADENSDQENPKPADK